MRFDHVVLKPFEQIGEHSQSGWELDYILKGHGIRKIGIDVQQFVEGDMVLVHPDMKHVWKFDDDTSTIENMGGTKTLQKFRDDPKSLSGVEWEVFQSMYKYETKAWDWRTRGYSNQLEPATNPWWFTSHSSIWNLTAKTLIIDFEEQGTFKTTYPVL